jgi:mRNA interferase HigB
VTDFSANRVPKAERRVVHDHLLSWFAVVSQAEWQNSAELKRHFRSASIISSDRVVFNIKGNDYRLVVSINYQHQIVFIKWLGTHGEYDKIDVATIEHDKERYADSSNS